MFKADQRAKPLALLLANLENKFFTKMQNKPVANRCKTVNAFVFRIKNVLIYF